MLYIHTQLIVVKLFSTSFTAYLANTEVFFCMSCLWETVFSKFCLHVFYIVSLVYHVYHSPVYYVYHSSPYISLCKLTMLPCLVLYSFMCIFHPVSLVSSVACQSQFNNICLRTCVGESRLGHLLKLQLYTGDCTLATRAEFEWLHY